MRLSAAEIMAALAELGPSLVQGGGQTPFVGLSTDSRKVKPGQLFLPLVGERFDGHDFIGQALAAGAAGAVYDPARAKDRAAWPETAALIEVPDTLAGLGLIARAWRLRFAAPVLAVTGSMGKSTVKEMAAAILGAGRRVLKNAGNLNNLVGLPQTLLDLDESHEAVVVELGINLPGEMERLARIAAPQAGLITNVAPVHLEGLGSLAGVARAKTALWREMGPAGTAVVNLEDPYLKDISLTHPGPRLTFGLAQADVTLVRAETAGPEGTDLAISVLGGEPFPVRLKALGPFNGLNAAAACAGALALGATAAEMAQGLAAFEPLTHRMRLKPGMMGLTLLDDAYNANPAAMAAALQTLVGLTRNGSQAAAVLGQMAELGAEAEAAHVELGRLAARLNLRLLVALGPFAPTVVAAARAAGLARAYVAADLAQAAELVLVVMGQGDKVLIKGSRVAGLERLVTMLGEADHGP